MNSTANSLLCSSILLGGAAWTPADLSNKVGWWSASNLHGYSDGDPVTVWPDGFGLLSDAIGTGTYRTGANGIGGQPAIEFNGSSNGYNTGYVGTPTDFFMWAVFFLATTGQTTAARVFDKNAATNGCIINRFSTSSNVVGWTMATMSAQVAYSGNMYAFNGRSGSSATFEAATSINAYSPGTSAMGTVELSIGYSKALSAGNMKGLVLEVGFLDGYPSAGDLTNLRNYITSKTGIPTS